MRVLITGVNGQLGHDAALEFAARGHSVTGTGTAPSERPDYVRLDLRDGDAVSRAVDEVMPDAVIHCAAWTAVDAAERTENREAVRAVNVHGTENLARACKNTGCKMLYISTDYVFPGTGDAPWTADCRDFAPCNFYGQTKLEGEFAVSDNLENFFVVRTAWLYGQNGNNFVKTMRRLARTHDTIRVVADQIGTPTYSRDLARLLADMAQSVRYGFYNATNEGGFISWYDFARAIIEREGFDTQVIPVTTAEYGAEAPRPLNSRLDKSKLVRQGFAPLPAWQDALDRFLAGLHSTENEEQQWSS